MREIPVALRIVGALYREGMQGERLQEVVDQLQTALCLPSPPELRTLRGAPLPNRPPRLTWPAEATALPALPTGGGVKGRATCDAEKVVAQVMEDFAVTAATCGVDLELVPSGAMAEPLQGSERSDLLVRPRRPLIAGMDTKRLAQVLFITCVCGSAAAPEQADGCMALRCRWSAMRWTLLCSGRPGAAR